jgi:predicted membrane protein
MKNSEIRNSEVRNSEIRKIFNKEIMEIIIAIILSLFIILDIRFSNNITNMLNTPIGLISLFLIIIIILIIFHPIIGILVIIYLYDAVLIKPINKEQTKKNKELKILNKGLEVVNVEEEIINNNAPIINKNKNNNVSYSPYVEKEYENYL